MWRVFVHVQRRYRASAREEVRGRAQWLMSRLSREDQDSSAHPDPPPMALASP